MLLTTDVRKLHPMATVLAGDDNRSHIFDGFGAPWCEDDVDGLDEAADVDCPNCIEAFEEEG